MQIQNCNNEQFFKTKVQRTIEKEADNKRGPPQKIKVVTEDMFSVL